MYKFYEETFLQIVLAFIMFGVGLSITNQDLKALLKNPKKIFIGLSFQVLFLPLFTVLFLSFFDINPYWKLGIFILSLCPGGATSNLISQFLKLDIPLSVSMTILNSLLIVFTIPIGVEVGVSLYDSQSSHINISLLDSFFSVLFVVLTPTVVGIIVNHLAPQIAQRITNPIKWMNLVLLGVTFLAKALIKNPDEQTLVNFSDTVILLPLLCLFQLGAMLGSFFLARKFVTDRSATTICVEVGLQNVVLSLLVISNFPESWEISQPSLIFGLFSLTTTASLAWLITRKIS